MKTCLVLAHATFVILISLGAALAQADSPQARIVTLTIEPDQVLILHLQPGYVSSVHVPEPVSSVVLGDPGTFKAEYSEGEPELVFFKVTISKSTRTNALITTKAGREISLTLMSVGGQGHGEPVDYVLNCNRPHTFLVAPTRASFLVPESRAIATTETSVSPPKVSHSETELPAKVQNPQWRGGVLRIAAGSPVENAQQMLVPFAVLNSSRRTIEVLPPQIELASASRDKRRKGTKAEPVPITDYTITTRTLSPGARADGVVEFKRPMFKESNEQLLLSVAQAEEVDRPVVVPIAFIASVSGGER